jgi:hypothetical protein
VKLWRIDADFEADGEVVGMLTYFSLAPEFDGRSDILVGWARDWYEVDAGELQRETVGELVGRPWPTLPLEDLVALARRQMESPALAEVDIDQRVELCTTDTPSMADAKRQLNQALNHRGHSSARVAWEKD